MFSEDYDTTKPRVLPVESATTDAWEQEVQPRLPLWWETQAAALGAWTRDREVHRPADLLRAILAYVLCGYSFRTLACWSVLSEVADLSDTAWRNRLRKAGDWLAWMLTQVVATGEAPTPWIVAKGVRRVRLVDGTHLRCRGLRGLVARVHMSFDLLGGRMSEVLVTDEHQGEDWNLFDVQDGDVFVSDRVNGYQQRIAEMVSRGAHVLVRISLSSLPLYDSQGTRIDLLAWLKGRHAPAGRVCPRQVWIHTPLLWVPVQLVALRLTQEQTQKAIRRKRKKATQDKSKVSDRAAYGAGWLLIVSTLPAMEWNAFHLLALYRSRWQIELLFKRIKQLLDVHQLRCEQWGRARASLLAYLLCWALQEEELVQIRVLLSQSQKMLEQEAACPSMPEPDLGQDGAISEWTLAVLCVDQLRTQVRGTFSSQRIRSCTPQLERFLRGSPRRRTHWFSRCVSWLAEPMGEGGAGEGSPPFPA